MVRNSADQVSSTPKLQAKSTMNMEEVLREVVGHLCAGRLLGEIVVFRAISGAPEWLKIRQSFLFL